MISEVLSEDDIDLMEIYVYSRLVVVCQRRIRLGLHAKVYGNKLLHRSVSFKVLSVYFKYFTFGTECISMDH